MRENDGPPPLAVGDIVLVRAEIVEAIGAGYRVKVPALTRGLTTYFCVDRKLVEPIPEPSP
jgi:hypothetical protein